MRQSIIGLTLVTAVACGGEPVHHARDVVINPGDPATVEGKFSHGAASKDLEGEIVRAYVRLEDVSGWRELGAATTDDDGRARIEIPAGLLATEGRFELRWLVEADGSSATGWVHVVAPKTKTVVFDIDGTLTTSDVQMVDGVVIHTVRSSVEGSPRGKDEWLVALEGVLDEDAEMYEGADDVVAHYVARGYQPVFITARPYVFDALTRDWLARRSFVGPVFMKQDVEAETMAYKRDTLLDLERAAQMNIELAYGNATTDICAYAEAGIATENTFIIGKHAGKACEGYAPTQPVTDYPSHLAEIEAAAN